MKNYFDETEMVNGKTDEVNKQPSAKSSDFYLYRLVSKSGFHLFKLAKTLFVATMV
jgi:hypothetical protein